MKIDTIHIKNFKGIADQQFRLNPHFTVFIGDNATGKTSVLDALAASMGSFFIEMGIGINTRTIQEHEVRTINTNGQARPQLPVSILTKGRVNEQEIVWKREIIKQKTTSKDAKSLSQLAQQMMQQSRAGESVIFPVIAYHGTGRLWAEHEEKKIGYQKQGEGIKMAYDNCLSAKSSSKEFLKWYKTQEDSIAKFDQPLDKAHLTAFKRTVLSLVPDERWQDMAFDRKQNELAGIFTDAQGQKHKLSYRQLSDGFRNIIGLAADIAYRCIQLNPHLAENAVVDTPGIVLIDELDLHLHPNWQRHVVADLKRAFPNIQFVATTHSPFVVQSLEAGELINLDKNENIQDLGINPIDLTLNQIATEVQGIEGINSDNFEERFQEAKDVFLQVKHTGKDLTTNDYLRLKDIVDNLLKVDTEDPIYKAYITVKNKHDETI